MAEKPVDEKLEMIRLQHEVERLKNELIRKEAEISSLKAIQSVSNAPSVANPGLLESLAVKEQRIVALEQDRDALRWKLRDMEQQVQNLEEKQPMLNESETKRKCDELTRQVDELQDQLQSVSIMIIQYLQMLYSE